MSTPLGLDPLEWEIQQAELNKGYWFNPPENDGWDQEFMVNKPPTEQEVCEMAAYYAEQDRQRRIQRRLEKSRRNNPRKTKPALQQRDLELV